MNWNRFFCGRPLLDDHRVGIMTFGALMQRMLLTTTVHWELKPKK